MSSLKSAKSTYTIKDIFALPEGQRAELLDGKLYMMAPPTTTHQRLLNYICMEINLYIRQNAGACEVFPAPYGVFLDKDEERYVEPDISVICDKDKIDERGCHGAPDWVVEIVSPSSRTMDYYIKLSEYKKAGVREYWIVDPDKQIVLVYGMEAGDAPVIYGFDRGIKVGIYDDLEIDLSGMRMRKR